MNQPVRESKASIFVFVYGSLQRGQRLHHYLHDQRFAGTARTIASYRLFDCGDYPGLVECGPQKNLQYRSTEAFAVNRNSIENRTANGQEPCGRSVRGEVYQIDSAALRTLDDVEGVSERLYARRYINLAAPFDACLVWAYFYLHDTSSLEECGSSWP